MEQHSPLASEDSVICGVMRSAGGHGSVQRASKESSRAIAASCKTLRAFQCPIAPEAITGAKPENVGRRPEVLGGGF